MSYHQDRDCVAIVYFKFPGERLESVLYWQSWRLSVPLGEDLLAGIKLKTRAHWVALD
jgi:hypothetical protein